MARCMATAAAWPVIRSSLVSEAGNSAEHQPPFRPEAPYPAISRSHTTMAEAGIGLIQVISGPQAGEAGPDDRDVGVGVAGQRVAWRQGAGHSVGCQSNDRDRYRSAGAMLYIVAGRGRPIGIGQVLGP